MRNYSIRTRELWSSVDGMKLTGAVEPINPWANNNKLRARYLPQVELLERVWF